MPLPLTFFFSLEQFLNFTAIISVQTNRYTMSCDSFSTKQYLCKVLSGVGIALTLLTSCVDDKNLDLPAVPNQSFVEEFDTLSSALARGWKLSNVSIPKGPNVWQQGGDVVPWFSPYSSNGSHAGFVGADYTSTTFGTISNWLISPPVTMQNGDKIIFYTRCLEFPASATPGDSTDFGNRLQVRLNTLNDGLSNGSGTSSGDFTSLILDINPTYLYSNSLIPEPLAYPNRWTRFEATVFGLNKPTRGRFAFRYFVENAGIDPAGGAANGNGIAIDYVTYKSVSH